MSDGEYRRKIDRLIRDRNGELVLNGSHGHAAIIIERMFANAETSVRILTRRFDPRVFGTNEIVEQSELFFGEQTRYAQVLVEQADAKDLFNHPFVAANKAAIDRGNLDIRLVPDWVLPVIKINFAVMDEVGYRFEPDKTKASASAAWGNLEITSKLSTMFSTIWQGSVAGSIGLPAIDLVRL